MKPEFVISCPIDTYSGYGARSRDLVKAIIELDKYDVRILSQRWGSVPWGFINDHEEWKFLESHLIPNNQMTRQPDIWMQITVPNEFQPVGKYNIGCTAGIETTICHSSWIEGCNKMDLNFVSSEHSKNVFLNSKYTHKDPQGNIVGELKLEKPIEVLLEGANLDLYKPTKEKPIISLNKIKEDFCYLFVGHWMQGEFGEDRKNVGLLVKSFYETFKNKKKQPALILKTSGAGCSYMDRREILRKLDHLRRSINSNKLPKIYFIHGEFTDEEMNDLYNNPKVKAMISLTKGEGFGRPLLEFSLTNKPIITTNWSGHIDFLQKEYTSLINGEVKQVHPSVVQENILIKESGWFSPHPAEIGHYFIDVHKNYKNYLEKGKRQGYYSRSNFSFSKMKEIIKELFELHIPEIAQQVELNLPALKKVELPKLKPVENE